MNLSKSNLVVLASLPVRFLAYVIDWVILLFATSCIRLPVAFIGTFSSGPMFSPLIFKFTAWDIIFYLIGVAYFVIMTYKTGSTFGKRIMKIRVVSVSGERLDLLNVIYRETIGRYLSSLFFIGYIIILITKDKQALHDVLCDTLVIYENNSFNYDIREKKLIPVEGFQENILNENQVIDKAVDVEPKVIQENTEVQEAEVIQERAETQQAENQE